MLRRILHIRQISLHLQHVMKKSLLYFALFAALHVGTALLFFSCLALYAWAAGIDSDVLLDAPWVEDAGLSLAFAVSFLVFIRLRIVRHMLTMRTAGMGKSCVLAALAALCIILIESPLTNALGLEEAVTESDPFASGSVLILFTGCLLGPFVEEMVFRGAMTGSMVDKRCNIIIVLTVPSLFFAAIHLIPELTPFYFAYGILAGWLAVRTGCLWPSIVFHATNNTVCAIQDSALPDIETLGETTATAVQWVLAAVAAIGLTLCIMALNRGTKTRKSVSYK